MNPSLYKTTRFRKKSNFTMEEIQFYIRKDLISNWNKSLFALEQIPVALEQIQFDIGANPISHWNKSNFTLAQINFPLEQIQFYIGTNPISH